MTKETMVAFGVSEISADVYGFQALAKLHAQLESFDRYNISIDCSRLRWIDAQLGTCLLTIVNLSRKKGNEITLHGISTKVQTILQKNRTLSGSVADRYGTTIPVTSFELNAEVEFSKYCSSHLLRPEVPKMSKGLREKFLEGLDELFANSSLHSKSTTPVFSGGQFFPNKDRLTFVISDGGRGISGSLEAAGKIFPTDAKSIEWAMQMNNSARSGDIPGGLGLGILQEFIRLNEGSLIVCSRSGYWEMRSGKVSMFDLVAPYPGTTVSLEINTRDARSYHMQSRVNPHEIW